MNFAFIYSLISIFILIISLLFGISGDIVMQIFFSTFSVLMMIIAIGTHLFDKLKKEEDND